MTSSPNFLPAQYTFRRRGAPEIVQHHRVKPRRAALLFLRLYYRGGGEWLFKAKNAERGDTLPESLSITPPRFPVKMPPRSPLSAGVHRPATPPTAVCTARSGTDVKSGPVSSIIRLITFLVFAHLPPPFRFCASCVLPGCCRSAALHSSVYCRNDSQPQFGARSLHSLFPSN